MNIIPAELEGVFIIEPKVFGDERGYFVETYRQDVLDKALNFPLTFIQDNESKSGYGVLRGLHYQLPPFAQTKLVRVIEGSVLDVVVDIRKGSPTFGQHITVELSGQNKRQLLIPRGFAHGFVVSSETAVFAYKVDNYYAPDYDRGIAFDDPELNIDWGIEKSKLQLSAKDQRQPFLNAVTDLFDYASPLY